MELITLDFETYYDRTYSLTKLTTEEYIRDPQFEVIGVAVKVNNGVTEWASGTREELKAYLSSFPWHDAMLLAHNTTFDAAILSWRFDIHPKALADTLCMGRALHGVDVGGSLKALSTHYQIGVKGVEVISAMGKRRADFDAEELARYGDYCVNDVELTYKLFNVFAAKKFPKQEMRVIDMTLRMFVEPILELDRELLEAHLREVKQRKKKLLSATDAEKTDIMSNEKLADMLKSLGVDPPTKVSPTTGKLTWAFAKSDEEFKALLDHEDDKVQALVAARIGTKSTLEETRAQRFIDISKRGKLPVPIRYYAAHTGRFGGSDKINLQNLPSRGPNGKKLKQSITAPEGYVLIDADSAQIEARVLAWLAEQDDLVQAFRDGKDVYKKMASAIYGCPEQDVTKDQRFIGKTTILGAGYGMGAPKFRAQLATFGVAISLDEARRIIAVYREANWKINQLWRNCQYMLRDMVNGDSYPIGRPGVLKVEAPLSGIRLPSGLLLPYTDLAAVNTGDGLDFSYKTNRGRTKIYGGKVTENICQAVARCVISDQMLRIAKRYRVVLTVHDSVVACVKEEKAEEAQQYIEAAMRWVPDWAEGLPLNCESGIGKTYGDCE